MDKEVLSLEFAKTMLQDYLANPNDKGKSHTKQAFEQFMKAYDYSISQLTDKED